MYSTRTSVFVLACILVFSSSASAFSGGPPPDRNGVSGQFCTMCHVSNPLNSGGGSVRILGVPSAWSPGETYVLSVVVSHPTAVRWGFQLSATSPNGDQAGELSPADNRTLVQSAPVNGKNVQFINHNSIGSTIGAPSTFQVLYKTPTSPVFGPIRFNVAGNAANGSNTNFGDFIYSAELIVPMILPTSNRQFTMSTRGGVMSSTAGAGTSLKVGYGRMQTSSGAPAAGLAIIHNRHAGVLVGEAAFPATPPIRMGRMYVEIGGGFNTAVALVNPNAVPANVAFYFTDQSGVNFGQSDITIPPNSQVASFLNEALFGSAVTPAKPVTEAGGFSFSSSVGISAVALRTRINERGEFMMAALPVIDLFSPSSTAPSSITHIADGGPWTSDVLLTNPSDQFATGTLNFYATSGQNLTVSLDGQSGNQFSYTVPPRSSRRFHTGGTATAPRTGWVRVAPTGGTQTPTASGILTARTNNVTSSETGIVGVVADDAFGVYVESSGNFTERQPGSVQTGVAISNPGTSSVTVTLELRNLEGTIVATTTQSIPARGQSGLLLGDIPPLRQTAPFNGTLWVSVPAGSQVSVSGLRARYNERQTPDLLVMTYPAFLEFTATDLVFPQIVDSAGFSTQFALGVRSGASTGEIRFFAQGGGPLQLPLR